MIVVSGYAGIDTTLVTNTLPRPGETAIVERESSLPRFGGCAPGVARRLQRLGLPAALVAWIGDDEEGRAYRALLEEEGVDLRGLEAGAGATPRSVLVYERSGASWCLFEPSGADGQRCGAAIGSLVAEASWLAVTVGPARLTRELLDLRLSLDTPPRLAWSVKADRRAYPPPLVAELAAAELVCLNELEAAFVGEALGLARAATADDFLARGARVVAVTRGMRGATLSWPGGSAELVPEPLTVRGTTGVGDAFFAGLLAGLAEGLEPAEAGKRGLAAAAAHLQLVSA